MVSLFPYNFSCHEQTGDRILEVEGVDLRGATHEKAVEVIKKTGNPVTFVVQSLVQWVRHNTTLCHFYVHFFLLISYIS